METNKTKEKKIFKPKVTMIFPRHQFEGVGNRLSSCAAAKIKFALLGTSSIVVLLVATFM